MEEETSRLIFMTISCLIMAMALSACCGFKVFVPPLLLGIFAKAGLIGLGENYAWLGSWPAIAVLSLATALETAAYFIPLVNNALDSIKIPASTMAGILTASAILPGEMSPLVRWTLAVLIGGGGAAAVSTGMASLRGTLTLTTAGFGSGLQNLAEAILSFLLSILAMLAPFLLCLAILLVLLSVIRRLCRRNAVHRREAISFPPE